MKLSYPWKNPSFISSWSLLRVILKDHVLVFYKTLALGIVSMMTTAIATAVLSTYLKPIFDDIFIGHKKESLYYTAFGVLVIFFIKGVSEYTGQLCMESAGQKMTLSLQERLFGHLIYMDVAFFRKRHGAFLISLLTNDVRLLRSSILQSITHIFKEVTTVVSLVYVMVKENPHLSFWALVGFPLALLPLIYCGRYVRRLSTKLQADTGFLQSFFQQIFHNITLIKISQTEPQEKLKLHGLLKEYLKKSLRFFQIGAIVHPVMEFFGGIAVVTVILIGGLQVMAGKQTAGSFLTFITALFFVYRPLKNILRMNNQLQEGLGAAERIMEALHLPPEETQCASQKIPLGSERMDLQSIHVQNIFFRYHPDHGVLHDFSVSFPGGQKIAIVGPSGSGKSSLFNLLARFYPPEKGRILWGSRDISHLPLSYLRSHISLVTQEIALFDASISENIAYGCDPVSPSEIHEAAGLAFAHEFIQHLPQGYHTPVGENGIRLSGGQRQRIALARAFLRKRPLLLLDEATSALDALSEDHIQSVLKNLQKTTCILIAHRLSTVHFVDHILVMKKGMVVEQGGYADLMRAGGTFHDMVLLEKTKLSLNETTS